MAARVAERERAPLRSGRSGRRSARIPGRDLFFDEGGTLIPGRDANPSPEQILRALADPERLAIAGLLAVGPRTLGDIASALGLRRDRARRHLSRLTAIGVARVDDDRRTYRLQAETLRSAATEVGPSRDPGLALGAVDEEEEAVLRHYFRGGRLAELPAKRSKRLIVLERIALEFEVGTLYPERAVNEMLRRFSDDHVTVRRQMVDEGFLSRDKGQYWRTGGRVEV